jgi:hypothetical protein
MWVLLWDKKMRNSFQFHADRHPKRLCFASFVVFADVYLTTFFFEIVASSLSDWFQKFRGHVMKKLNISTLEDEATTLPQSVGNLTHSDAASFPTIVKSCVLLRFDSMPLSACSDKIMEEHWNNELARKNRNTRRCTCLSATSSTTNSTQTYCA